MVTACDWAIDIHTPTPTRGGRYVPIAILPHPSLGEAHTRAEEMAHAFGSGWIMRTDTGFYVADLTRASLGDVVNEGDLLCSIVNVYEDEVETITAPARGVFVRSTTLSTVSRGERAATLGLF